MKTAQRYLGHADVVTTLRIYTHLSEQKQKTFDEALNRWFDGHVTVGQKSQPSEECEAK